MLHAHLHTNCELWSFALTPPDGSLEGDSLLPRGTTHIGPSQIREQKQLTVLHKQQSQGKILYMQPRPNHLSFGPDSSLWQLLFPQDLRVLETELRHVLKPKCVAGDTDSRPDYLRVAMGHMLERIVYWDREEAIKFEVESRSRILSTVPVLEAINRDKMSLIVEKFRSAMRRLANGDWRRNWGDLNDEALNGLLRFTLLNARPVLAWELDFDKVG